MLIIALPHSANTASNGFDHVHSDGERVLRHATGAAATLSAHAGEVVAVIPYSRLSWLTVQLPPGSQGARLRLVLNGLLEDRLLDEVEQLHLALPPDIETTARTGGETLVAVCDKAWLRQALAPLDAAGLTVQRLVPELAPSDTPVLHVMGEPDHAHCVLCHANGVTLLPPNTAQWQAFAAFNANDLQIQSEPAMVARVQSTLQRQPLLQSAAQRWVAATQCGWDLAQGEWAQGRAQRWQRLAQAAWQALRHAPAWRPVRWGLAALLAVQVVGLNALAWREHAALNEQHLALQQILKTTFPSVTVIIDAPLQMQREINVLQQKSGAASQTDLEPLLAALASTLPTGQLPTQLHYANQTLRVHGITPTNPLHAQLKAQGLALRQESNDVWVLQAEGAK